ncbi:MAG: hypothetical protein HY882_02320 [Deltaproteobacteria bacterium]|nr:hypothetical protein [Deltaproteobacteria bacterium]
MGRVNIDALKPGMVLAEDLYHSNGRLLLSKGVSLDSTHLRILKIWGVGAAEIEGASGSFPPPLGDEIEPAVLQAAEQITQKQFSQSNKELEEANRFTIDALEMAASLGDFQSSIHKLQDPLAILQETGSRVKRLLPFQAIAFYILDEANSNFTLAHGDPESQLDLFKKEVDF